MRTMPAILSIALAAAFLAVTSDVSQAKGERRNRDRVARDFMHADQDGDRRISRDEWNRRGNFDRLDADGDGFLSLREVRAMYRGHDDKDYDWPPAGMAKPTVEIDPSIAADRVEVDALDNETKCGIGRMMRCATADQKKRGLFETGTGPHFPDGAVCPGIDDYWAMDYGNKRNRESYHGGIDVPVPWGTPVRAVADGSVVAMYRAEQSKRGTEVVLRHGPEQTGLPVWTYSAYGHLDALPDLKIGQRVRMGQILAPTGNSGIAAMGTRGSDQSATRRPAVHLAMFFSDTGIYGEANDTIIPKNGRWLDPMAFYRGKAPFDSDAVRALPDAEKSVPIPVLFGDGTTLPAVTRMIWPYSCTRN